MTPRPFPDRAVPLAQLCGACLGLFVFAMMVLRGLWSGNAVETILVRALAGLAAATILGAMAGLLAERVIREALTPHKEPDAPPTEAISSDITGTGG